MHLLHTLDRVRRGERERDGARERREGRKGGREGGKEEAWRVGVAEGTVQEGWLVSDEVNYLHTFSPQSIPISEPHHRV